MHWRHRESRFHHFHDTGSHFRILADAVGRGLTETYSLHPSGQGPVPLDHVTHGTVRLSSQFPTTHGRGTPQHSFDIDDLLVHTDTHEKHLQLLDQVLARLHKNHLKINLEKCVFGKKKFPTWDLLFCWKESNWAKTNWSQSKMPNCHRYQDDQVLCGPMQLLLNAYQGLRFNCSTFVQELAL